MNRIALALLALLLALPANAQQTSKEGTSSPQQVREFPPSAKRWALIIGVDQYDDPQIGRLEGAATDARTLRDALIANAGFPQDQVVVLASGEPAARWPTRVNILRRLTNLVNTMPHDGLLLLAFSGHGIERDRHAYLLPKDSQLSDDPAFLEATAISLDWIRDRIESGRIDQVVVLLDACRNDPGGRANAPNRLSDAYLRPFHFDLQNHKIRAFATLYATAVGARAYEYTEKQQGYFTWAIVDALRGAAANEKGEVTLGRLVRYVQDTVPKRIAIDLGNGYEQLPLARIEGYQAEDLVLAVAKPWTATPPGGTRVAESVAPRPNDAQAEMESNFWQSTEKLDTVNAYDEYLHNYPSGIYAGLARMNKAALVAKNLKSRSAAEHAFRSGDYTNARRLLQQSVDRGDADAEARLGAMTLLGLGTACSTPEATRLLESAAQKGSHTAEAWLGFLWATRGGVRARGLHYARAAAERNDTVGLVALATAYEFGITIPPDQQAADRLYKQALPDLRLKASTDRDPWALLTLGKLHQRARAGLLSDTQTFVDLFQQAAKRGLPEAKTSLASRYAAIYNKPKENQKALPLYREAAAQGDPEALRRLAEWYLSDRAEQQKNVQRAVELLRSAAETGYPPAQASLAYLHLMENGVEKDLSRAAELLTLAASQGHPPALRYLAVMRARGDGGLTNDDHAIVSLYSDAADRGDPWAQLEIGIMHEYGTRGLPADLEKAAMWYQKASDQFVPEARTRLAYFYHKGLGGLAKDPRQAAWLYEFAADQGDSVAQVNLGLMYEHGAEGHRIDLTKAARLYKEAADQNNAAAERLLAGMYLSGTGGLPRDEPAALTLLQKAAGHGDATAQATLGDWHLFGRGGLQKDPVKAAAFYRAAAEQGDAHAQTCLGTMYVNGVGGLQKNDATAVEWLSKAAAQGAPLAQAKLGLMYDDGRGGLPRNPSLAIEWFRKAADQGEPGALMLLALFYERGRAEIPKDIDKAIELYRKAAAQGNEDAKKSLARLSR